MRLQYQIGSVPEVAFWPILVPKCILVAFQDSNVVSEVVTSPSDGGICCLSRRLSVNATVADFLPLMTSIEPQDQHSTDFPANAKTYNWDARPL